MAPASPGVQRKEEGSESGEIRENFYNCHLLKNLFPCAVQRATVPTMTKGLRRYEFSQRLAEILGESQRDLRVRVTLMVSGGLVPPGPRGPGAPLATPDYAAKLLIGVMAAPQQTHTVEAVRCYEALRPVDVPAGTRASGIYLGAPGRRHSAESEPLLILVDRPDFGAALARLIDQGRTPATAEALADEVFGIWLSRGFPNAAIQFAAGPDERRSLVTQRYELAEGAPPPAWLDPDRGGMADSGLFHTVFLPVRKLIEIGSLTSLQDERTPAVPGLGQTISQLSQLARENRHRRPWKEYLAKAATALSATEEIEAKSSRLAEVTEFGSNPGNLRMMVYIPDDLPPSAPLVVALHGCTQTAACYDYGTGWSTLADRHGFAVLLPEQRRTNNPLRCFNWFKPEETSRSGGEAMSIRQMVERVARDHGTDPSRVYATGVSAGGAMTSAMLASYPEMFAGGAIIAGVPYRCAEGLQEGFEAIFQARSRQALEWGNLVRDASHHRGPWPTVAVWHGDADRTVNPANAREIVKQWTDVHGLSAAPTSEDTLGGHRRLTWRGDDGRDLIQFVSVAGMGHGVPIDPNGEDGCGNAAPFILDVGISSTKHIAQSWGLTAVRRQTIDVPHRVAETETAPPPPRSPGPRPTQITIDANGREIDDVEPGGPERQDDAEEIGAPRTDRGSQKVETRSPGIDVEAILTRSFEAAGLLSRGQNRSRGTEGDEESFGGGLAGGIDIEAILTKSFEAAGLLKNPRPSPKRSASSRALGVDIPAILARSFEAAGLLRTDHQQAETDESDIGGPATDDHEPEEASPAPASEAPASNANSSPVGDGWELLDGGEVTAKSEARAMLHGNATSGVGRDLGNRARTVSCRLALGNRPLLSYSRRLDLKAAANMVTTAAFTVLVDGVAVDEASAVGMDYAERDWTERTDIDLTSFAGREVTLTFEVAANANVSVEVFAKAWIRDIVIQDAVATADEAGPAATAGGAQEQRPASPA